MTIKDVYASKQTSYAPLPCLMPNRSRGAKSVIHAAAHERPGVTQPAVGRSVRRLEATPGANLFTRSHRSVELAEAGDMLSRAVSPPD